MFRRCPLLFLMMGGSASAALPPPTPPLLPASQRQQLVQLLIDLPELQGFYHAELPARHPLQLLATPVVSPDLVLRKFNQPVRILSAAQLARRGSRDYLHLTQLRVHGDTADFRLGYAIEGVVAAGQLVRQPQRGWVVHRYAVAEQ